MAPRFDASVGRLVFGGLLAEPLESRQYLTTVTLTANGGNNAFLAQLDGNGSNVNFYINGSPATPVSSVPLAQLGLLQIDDNNSSFSDTITVNVPGGSIPLDTSAAPWSSLNIEAGNVSISNYELFNFLTVGAGSSFSMVGSSATVAAEDTNVSGNFQHQAGLFVTPALQIASGGTFLDAGGTISNSGGVAINNQGIFDAAFDGSLANTTGIVSNTGTFEDTVTDGGTTTLGMAFNNAGGTIDLAGNGILATTSALSFANNTSSTIEGTGTLSVPSLDDADAIITQQGGTLNVTGNLDVGDGAANAAYNLSGGTINVALLYIGGYPSHSPNPTTGVFTQSGGTVNASSGVQVGDGYGDYGFYNISSGTVNAGSFSVGNFSYGALTQSGGSINVSGSFSSGTVGTATITQSGGSDVLNDLELGQYSGTASYALSGGSLYVYALNLGVGGTGTFNLSGSGSLSTQYENLASNGASDNATGTFDQSGGTNSLYQLTVGLDNAANNTTVGTYALSSGTLTANVIYVGLDQFASAGQGVVAEGTFTQTGGSCVASSGLLIGYGAGASGAYNLQGGSLTAYSLSDGTLNTAGGGATFSQSAGQSSFSNGVAIGGTSAPGLLSLSGGSMSVGSTSVGAMLYVGYASSGTLNQSGGTLTVVGNLYVTGDGQSGDDPAGNGTYTLSGSGQLNTANTFVGYGGNGKFNQTGGTQSTGYFVIDGPSGSIGLFNKTGGSLTMSQNGGQVLDVLKPTAGGASTVNVGALYTLSLMATSNVGDNAITAWAVNWGDGSNDSLTGNPPPSSDQHTYTTPGNDTINATASGGNQSFASTPVNVLVTDVAATAAPVPAFTINAGANAYFSTTFAGAYNSELQKVSVNWGDDGISNSTVAGSGATISQSGSSGGISANHVYEQHGTYTVVITMTAVASGATSQTTFQITVNYVAPTLKLVPPLDPIYTSQPFTLQLQDYGPEATGVTSWLVNWGDGSPSTTVTDSSLGVNGTGALISLTPTHSEWDVPHTYAASGNYTITATAIDSSGALTVPSATVHVQQVAPVVTISGGISTAAFSGYTLNLSATYPAADATPGTISSWTINWGDGAAGSADTQTFQGNPAAETHIYTTGPGPYSITATATDAHGTYTAQTWGLDTGFNAGGTVTHDAGTSTDSAYASAIDSQGRIVVAGGPNCTVMRFLPSGALDTSFNGGVVTIPNMGTAYGVAIGPNDSVIVGGGVGFDVARLTSAGVLDTSFGTRGNGTTTNVITSTAFSAYDLTVQPDGKILLAGGGSYEFAFARFNADGTIDTSFGIGGRLYSDLGSTVSRCFAVTTQSDGKILAAGYCKMSNGDYEMALARYTTFGVLDTTFGPTHNGLVLTSIGSYDAQAFALAVQPNGDIVLAGSDYSSGTSTANRDFALVRYTSAGLIDTTFGPNSNGIVTTDFGYGDDQVYAVQILPGGDILAAGHATGPDGKDFGLALYSPGGILNPAFGTGGLLTTKFAANTSDSAETLTADANGNVYVAGAANGDFGLAHYWLGTATSGNTVLPVNVSIPTTIVVNNAADLSTTSDGTITLREAVNLADAAGGNYVISFATSLQNQTISLNSSNGPLLLNDATGTLTINGLGANYLTVSGSQLFTVGAGDTVDIRGLTLNGATQVANATVYGNNLFFSGGSISGSGLLSLSGTDGWSGGTDDVQTTVNVGAVLNVSNVTLGGSGVLGVKLNNFGTVNESSNLLVYDSASINNQAGGVFDFTSGNIYTEDSSSGMAFNNYGTLEDTSASGTTFGILLTNEASGTVTETAGTWYLNDGGSNANVSGTAFSATGGSMEFGGGTFTFTGNTAMTTAGSGQIDFDGATINTSGTLSVNNDLFFSGGSISGSGLLSLSGTDGWSGGTDDVQTTINVGAVLNVSNVTLGGSGVLGVKLNNFGTVNVSANVLVYDSASINNQAGGVFDFTSGNIYTEDSSSGMAFNNYGLLEKTDSSTTSLDILLTNEPGDTVAITGSGNLATGNFSLPSSSNLDIAINGSGTSGYGRLQVTGVVSINGANLNLTGLRPAHPGDVLTLISNDATDAVNGTFSRFPEGLHLVLNGATYALSYRGGDGNDVTLSDVSSGSATVPTATIAGASSTGIGAPYQLTLSAFETGAHAITGWTINWGDGSSPQVIVGNPSGVTHEFSAISSGNLITATVSDDVGTYAVSNYVNVALNDVAPTVTARSDLPNVYPDATFHFPIATFTDSSFSASETYSATINWGDGSPVMNGSVSTTLGSPGTLTQGTVSGQHEYDSPGTYSVTVTVQDSNGGSNSVTEALIVQPPPTPYVVPGPLGSETEVSFTITNQPFSALYRNELGMYFVDDQQYDIGSVSPSDPNYTETALSDPSRQVIFPRETPPGAVYQFTLPAGELVAFYIVQDATTNDYLNGTFPSDFATHEAVAPHYLDDPQRPNVFFVDPAANFDDFMHVRFSQPAAGVTQYGFEDETGGGDEDFNDIVFTVGGVPVATSGGTISGTVTEDGGGVGVDAEVAADNDFGLYYGAQDGTGIQYVGRNNTGGYDYNGEGFDFRMPGTNDIYMVQWDDDNGWSWALGDFQFAGGAELLTNPTDWSYYNTGPNPLLNAAQAPSVSQVTTWIQQANSMSAWATPEAVESNSVDALDGVESGVSLFADKLWISQFNQDMGNFVVFKAHIPAGLPVYGSGPSTSLAGRTVYINTQGSPTYTSGDPSAVTDSNGNYTITGLSPGQYQVGEVVPGGWVQQSPSTPSDYGPFDIPYSVSVGAGSQITGIDFITDLAPPDNLPPTLTTAATASPATVSGTSTSLNVLGTDTAGESTLEYYWRVVGTPPAPVLFSDNGDNTAKNVTATFYGAGTYDLAATAIDANGLVSTESDVTVTVNQTLSSLTVGPASVSVPLSTSSSPSMQQFLATATDQFGNAMAPPATLSWSTSGGSINSNGLYTAPTAGSSATVSVNGGGVSSTAAQISLTTAGGSNNPQPPVIASFTATPVSINGKTITLTAILGGAGIISSDISMLSGPAGASPQALAVQGTAANVVEQTITFNEVGSYVFGITSTDSAGSTSSKTGTIVVSAILTTLAVNPATITLNYGAEEHFTASAADQFGNAMAPPTQLNWTLSGGGSIDANTGVYTAPTSGSGGSVTVASGGVISSAATITLSTNGNGGTDTGPTIVNQPSASPPTVSGDSTMLSLSATDIAGEPTLTYTWSIVGSVPAPVAYSDNDSNAAKTVLVTFSAAGQYLFKANIISSNGENTTSRTLLVSVEQTLTSLVVSPSAVVIALGSTQQFTATGLDQFGHHIGVSGDQVSWSTLGAGMVNPEGVYTAPTSGSADVVRGSVGYLSITASITLGAIPAVIATPKSDDWITLSWSALANTTPNYFELFRDSSPDFEPSYSNLVSSTDLTSVQDENGLTANRTYYYQIYEVSSTSSVLLVGTASATTTSIQQPASVISPPTNLQAVGVNDLEVFLSWTPSPATDGQLYNDTVASDYLVQESTDGVHWFDVATAVPSATNCLVRGCGLGGSGFLQEGVAYQFRVETVMDQALVGLSNFLESGYSNVATASVLPPDLDYEQGQDMVVIVAGNLQPLSTILDGIEVAPSGSGKLLIGQTDTDSVGRVWADLVNSGINCFISADPHDGGAYPGGYFDCKDGERIYSVLNNDGSGRLYDEIQYELNNRGIFSVGLIGYSHGGGMIQNISNKLYDDSDTPTFCSVALAVTIDGVAYGTGANGFFVFSRLTTSPAVSPPWGGAAFNYWEPNGYQGPDGVFFVPVGGQNLPGSFNQEFNSDDHSTIAEDDYVLTSVESNVLDTFGQLSGF